MTLNVGKNYSRPARKAQLASEQKIVKKKKKKIGISKMFRKNS